MLVPRVSPVILTGKDAMQQATNFILRCANGLRCVFQPEFLGGLAAGGALCLAAQSWLALYGPGLSASLAGLLASCAGVSLGIVVARTLSTNTFPLWLRWLSLTVWIGLLPWWAMLGEFGPGWFSASLLESIPLQMLAMSPAAVTFIGLPAFLIAFTLWGRESETNRPILWSLWAGAAVCTFGGLPLVGTQNLFWCVVAVSLGAAGWCAWGSGAATSPSLLRLLPTSTPVKRNARRVRIGDETAVWLFPVISGFLLVLVSMFVRQYCPMSVPVLMAQALFGALGFLIAMSLSGSHHVGRLLRRIPVMCWLFVPVLCAQLMIVCESTMTQCMLILNTQWSSPFWLLAARMTIVSLFPLVVGWSTGIWYRHAARNSRACQPSFWIGAICLAGLAWGMAECLLAGGFQVDGLLIAAGVTTLLVGTLSFTLDRGRSRVTGTWGYRLSRLAVTSMMGCVIVGVGFLPSDTGQLPARVLFSPVAAAQFQAGLDWRLVPHVDDARLVDQIQTEHGLLTIYNYHGLETALRCDGIPAGYLSHDYRLMPQFPSDVLMAVLPSILHGGVRDVAICHWNCGVTVSSTLEFPVEHVDCFDAPRQLVNITYGRHLNNPWAGLNPITDTRVRLGSVSAVMALRTEGASYDVIISDPPRSMLAEAAEEMTAEFYRSTSERLRPGGLFCQRFLHYDHGPHAWTDVLSTLRSVYPHVAAIEMIPGETLFVASTSQDFTNVPDLADRLQKPQIRRVLSRFGWDWGHVLRLPTVHASHADELLSQVPGDLQSVLTPELFRTHVPDALRWANKWEEKTLAFAPFRGRLADLAGEEAQSGEVQRRMEEVVAQQNTMSEQVDLPWVYRSKLKEILSLKPRSEIVHVKGEKPKQEMHPVDKRRVDYLEALSEAHNTRPLSAGAIERLAAYDTPFDPLISYFLHYEAAELYARLSDSEPRAEFQHRLKTIYFADVRDKSVRNVVAALNLLLENEDLVSSPQERFDHLHGLLQFLLNRWQLRKGYVPRNTDEALVDIQDSLSVAQRGMEALDRLAVETGFGAENWADRREYLELCLMTPLRSYRSRMLPHFERTVHKRNEHE